MKGLGYTQAPRVLQYRDADAPPVVTFYDVFALLLPGGLEALEQQFLELFIWDALVPSRSPPGVRPSKVLRACLAASADSA